MPSHGCLALAQWSIRQLHYHTFVGFIIHALSGCLYEGSALNSLWLSVVISIMAFVSLSIRFVFRVDNTLGTISDLEVLVCKDSVTD